MTQQDIDRIRRLGQFFGYHWHVDVKYFDAFIAVVGDPTQEVPGFTLSEPAETADAPIAQLEDRVSALESAFAAIQPALQEEKP